MAALLTKSQTEVEHLREEQALLEEEFKTMEAGFAADSQELSTVNAAMVGMREHLQEAQGEVQQKQARVEQLMQDKAVLMEKLEALEVSLPAAEIEKLVEEKAALEDKVTALEQARNVEAEALKAEKLLLEEEFKTMEAEFSADSEELGAIHGAMINMKEQLESTVQEAQHKAEQLAEEQIKVDRLAEEKALRCLGTPDVPPDVHHPRERVVMITFGELILRVQ